MTRPRLAVDGGAPVRSTMLQYARQSIDDADVAAVVDALRSDWLTTGPRVAEFEAAFAELAGARHAVAVANGTAALHALAYALDVRQGDEVIVPALTFAATANCVAYCGGTPLFADVDPESLLIRADEVDRLAGPRARGVIAVDYTGQPAPYDELRSATEPFGGFVAADACHAPGAEYRGRRVGSVADASAFSLHAVKPLTTAEGGVVTTDDAELAERIRVFRNHGITRDHRARAATGSWFYEMSELGFNYRLTDLQCALGTSQLHRLAKTTARRREIARRYDEAFADLDAVRPLARVAGATHVYHLYVVLLQTERLTADRAEIFAALRAEGIGVNVHYVPVHLHPYYRRRYGTGPGLCPVAEDAYERMLSLPMFAGMSEEDIEDVVAAVEKVTTAYART